MEHSTVNRLRPFTLGNCNLPVLQIHKNGEKTKISSMKHIFFYTDPRRPKDRWMPTETSMFPSLGLPVCFTDLC